MLRAFPRGIFSSDLLRREPNLKAFALLALLLVCSLAGFAWAALHWPYSVGQRAGYLQKLSHRGNACKTWEGELVMTAAPGVVVERFEFSVPSDAVASQLNATVGKRVALQYEQHKGVPSSCFGDTQYYVTGVRVID